MGAPIAVSFQYRGSPIRLFSGSFALRGLAREAADARAILMITSPSCMRAGIPERIRAEVGIDFGVFSEVERESPVHVVERARVAAVDREADLLIGVGGGSAMVTTRAVAIALRKESRDVRNVLVPTTPTTAMSRAGAAVLDFESHSRIEHYDPGARAAAVILDVAALSSSPDSLFRDAAAAAFCSAVELLTVPALHAPALADATAAVTLLAEALIALNGRAQDEDLRLVAGSAAFLSGRAGDSMPGVSPGIVHALAHQLQARHGISQGAAMSSLMAAGLRYDLDLSAHLETRLRRAVCTSVSREEKAANVIGEILSRAGLPVRCRDLRLKRADLRAVAESALGGFFATRAARPPRDADDLQAVLEEAW